MAWWASEATQVKEGATSFPGRTGYNPGMDSPRHRNVSPDVWLGSLAGARVLRGAPQAITGVTHDSRQVEPGFLFVAIPGFKTDGHAFIPDALRRGAAVVLAQEDHAGAIPAEATPVVLVADTRVALAQAAAAFWDHPARRLGVIGVTGTDGKTTTTHLIAAILQAAGHPTGYLSSVEFKTGEGAVLNATHMTTVESPEVQARLAEMVASGQRYAVVEASSHGLELRRLDACEFDVGVFTNLTRDHLDFHETMEAYRDAKARLFQMVAETPPKAGVAKAAVLNARDAASAYMASRCPGVPVYWYGLASDAALSAQNVESGPEGTAFDLMTPEGTVRCCVRLPGLHNVENGLAAAAVAASQGIAPDAIAHGLESFTSVPGRLESIDEGQPFRVLVDIASTPEALRKVLDVLRPSTSGRLIVLFGAAGERDRARRTGMGQVAAELADFAILANEDPRSEDPEAIIADIARAMIDAGATEGERFVRVPDRREAIARAFEMAGRGDTVLLAGKGSEQAIDVKDGPVPWDERVVARELLRRSPAAARETRETAS